MRLVAVTRIMNEDDIVEAFVRHHRPQVDHHLFLDNGSVDRTVEILRALQAEGMELTVLQNRAPFYAEVQYNTALFEVAARHIGADWVLFLDTDEFVDARQAPGGLRARIAQLPPDIFCLAIPTITYFDTATDDEADLLVPRRMRNREPLASRVNTKVVVRASLAGVIEIEGGQHSATLKGQTIPAPIEDRMVLAHYYRRGPYQMLWKNVMGHLKVVAGGKREIEKQRNFHYASTYETIRDAPERLLRDPGWLAPSYAGQQLVTDPIRYEGGELRYTETMDGPMKAIRVMLGYGEDLARDFGEMIDAESGARAQAERKAATWSKLF
jgi:hypothetical protein